MPESALAAAKAVQEAPVHYVVITDAARQCFVKNGLPATLYNEERMDDWFEKQFGKKDVVLVSDSADLENGAPIFKAAARRLYGKSKSLGFKALPADFLIESDAEEEPLKFIGAENAAEYFEKAHSIPVTAENFERFEEALDSLIELVSLDDVIDEEINWLWPERFARGKLNIISGDGGMSKSTFVYNMAARCSQANGQWPLNEGPAPYGTTLILSCEDDPADTIKPRICAAGGDPRKIKILQAVKIKETKGKSRDRMFDISIDLPLLERTLKQLGDVVLLIIDPLNAYLGTRIDGWKDQHIRAVLGPLALAAARHDLCVVIIAHQTKESKRNALQMIMGSAGIGNLVRMAWAMFFVKDEDDEVIEGQRQILPAKYNITKLPPGLSYHLAEQPTGLPNAKVAVCCMFDETVDKTADQAMAESSQKKKNVSEDISGAMSIIGRHIRAAMKDRVHAYAKDIQDELRAAGYSPSTERTACDKLNVNRTNKEPGTGGKWYWTMPERDNDPM